MVDLQNYFVGLGFGLLFTITMKVSPIPNLFYVLAIFTLLIIGLGVLVQHWHRKFYNEVGESKEKDEAASSIINDIHRDRNILLNHYQARIAINVCAISSILIGFLDPWIFCLALSAAVVSTLNHINILDKYIAIFRKYHPENDQST